jgi:prolyl 4-hydroxylase
MPHHPDLTRAIQLSAAGRNPEAVAIIRRLAAANDAEALAMLAELTWRGGMVPQDPVAARHLFRRAGERGHASAGIFYTNLLASGISGPRDWAGALARMADETKISARRQQVAALIAAMPLTADGDPVALPLGEPLSTAPHVTLFRALFTPAECDYLITVATPMMQPSTVNTSTGQPVKDPIRTSDGATIDWMIEDPAVHALNRRLAAISGTDAAQGEALQILRYRPGQQYKPHYDFVRASENQRHLTALVWLNTGYTGGETAFAKTGLAIKGERGDCLLFRNALPDRSVDPLSEHAGRPVTAGEKLLASRWIREQRWAP